MAGRILVYTVRAGIALVLLTPFVVSPSTIFPFVVGKALYSRTVIEIVFAAWVLLRLSRPSCRRPCSRLLILLAAALGVAVLSAGSGVSVQRSLWSSYERMQGVIDQAHWLALAVVLASVLRTGRDWRIVLALNLAVCTAVALVTIAEYHGWARLYAPDPTTVRATLGNSVFLGAYLGVNVTIALGFLVRSLVPATAPAGRSASPGEEPGPGWPLRRHRPGWRLGRARRDQAARCAWGAAALIGLWALTLTASRGAFLGFVSGLAFLAVLYAFLAPGRPVRAVAATAAALLGGAVAGLLVLSFSPAASLLDAGNANPLLHRFADHGALLSVHQRLIAWEAGIGGFLERPMLGWGPENYIVIWGRHGPEFPSAMPGVFDHAHNELIETLATKGLSGLLVLAAVWGVAFHVVLRTAGGRDPRERVPVMFVGAALMGQLVQSMTNLDLAVGSLQLTLLLAFVAHLEYAADRPAATPEGRAHPSASPSTGRLARLAGTPGARVALGAATIALAGGGLITNSAVWSSARAVNDAYVSAGDPAASPGPTRIRFERAIDGFEPLAGYPRRILFRYAAERWAGLRARHREEAMRLLAMVDTEASAAVAGEPENWRIYPALIRFYTAVAATDPDYRAVAIRHRDRALALAPHLEVPAVNGRR